MPHPLLLSATYARQIILATPETLTLAEVDRQVQACRRRQDVLDADPHRRPGGPGRRGALPRPKTVLRIDPVG